MNSSWPMFHQDLWHTGQDVDWAFTTGGEVDTSPALGPDGTIYVGVKNH